MASCFIEGTPIEDRGFGYTMKVLSGKYKMIVIYWLSERKIMRYSEIKRSLGRVIHKMMSQTLKELEQAGLINRHEYPQVPPKVEHSLTDEATELVPILGQLCDWGDRHRK